MMGFTGKRYSSSTDKDLCKTKWEGCGCQPESGFHATELYPHMYIYIYTHTSHQGQLSCLFQAGPPWRSWLDRGSAWSFCVLPASALCWRQISVVTWKTAEVYHQTLGIEPSIGKRNNQAGGYVCIQIYLYTCIQVYKYKSIHVYKYIRI